MTHGDYVAFRVIAVRRCKPARRRVARGERQESGGVLNVLELMRGDVATRIDERDEISRPIKRHGDFAAPTVRRGELIEFPVPCDTARIASRRAWTSGVSDVGTRPGRRIAEGVEKECRRGALCVDDRGLVARRICDCIRPGLPLNPTCRIIPEPDPDLRHSTRPVVCETVDMPRAVYPKDQSVRRVVGVVLGET